MRGCYLKSGGSTPPRGVCITYWWLSSLLREVYSPMTISDSFISIRDCRSLSAVGFGYGRHSATAWDFLHVAAALTVMSDVDVFHQCRQWNHAAKHWQTLQWSMRNESSADACIDNGRFQFFTSLANNYTRCGRYVVLCKPTSLWVLKYQGLSGTDIVSVDGMILIGNSGQKSVQQELVGKPSAGDQPTGPTQPFILSG